MPELPAVPGTTGLRSAVADAFSPTGALARVVEGYELREGQRLMADAVASVIELGGTLIAEAGTGTGKTLAYLIPAILGGHRVLVSTGTKNLQEQIYTKDLPALQNALGTPFTATLMKGRSNYLCLHRLDVYRQSADEPRTFTFDGPWESAHPGPAERSARQVFLPIIDAWVARTDVGDRAELRNLPEDLPLWKEIAADAETCLGTDCQWYDDCFVTRMRQRAAESDIVIVNHHLLCADASVRQDSYGEVIPSCSTLIVDEAHQLEDVATQYFGVAASNFRVDSLVRDGTRLVRAGMFGERSAQIHRALERVAERSRGLFEALAARGAAVGPLGAESRWRYTADTMADHFEEGMALAGALEGLEAVLALTATTTGAEADPGSEDPPPGPHEAAQSLQRRSGQACRDLRFLIRASDPDFVYYLESRGRGHFLRASPIDVSRVVRDALFDRMRTTVLTSATLAVDGSFDYVKGRLGVRAAEHMQVASEFDYARQTLLYLPRRMPPPRSPGFAAAVARETVELLRRSRGRAFVLFTSYSALRAVQPEVVTSVPFPVLVQGSAPRSMLLDEFRSTPNAVLLATASFWQGVDVAGDALSCVIIDKLPFASPAEPVTAARIEAIRAGGGDAFADYQVPIAILALLQGLGRLIRHRSDRGVLAVLDPRLRTMGYGRRFRDSLPPAPVTHDLDAVERFFM